MGTTTKQRTKRLTCPPLFSSPSSIRLRQGHTNHILWGHRISREHVGRETRMEKRVDKQWEVE